MMVELASLKACESGWLDQLVKTVAESPVDPGAGWRAETDPLPFLKLVHVQARF